MVDVGAGAGGPSGSRSKASGEASASGAGSEGSYSLLNDQPVENVEGDLLGMTAIAESMASVIVASMSSAPFVLAVDAGWGMGKSTLLRQIEHQLSGRRGLIKLRFNAWTAEGEDALEGLIKAVLGQLDPNILRRWVRRLGRQRSLVGFARLALALVARSFGVARLVDELWEQMAADAKTRNELRDWIYGMLSEWIQHEGKGDHGRALAVFIDDLDRCSDDVIVRVCEAVKLYLDAPGLIFIMACDQSVLARGVSASARGEAHEGRAYLEKVVQVAYRMPPAEEYQLTTLIRAYAAESGTAELIDDTVTKILAEGTGRNPRRIKRIINSFVIEYRLDPAWRQPPLGSAQLVTAILLQHLYAPFYDLLVNEESAINPIEEFLDYVQVRERVSDPPADDNDPWWGIVQRSFKTHYIQPPDREKLTSQFELLERQLPDGFPELSRSNAFIDLLHRVEQAGAVHALRAQLERRPLATASPDARDGGAEVRQVAGRRRWSVKTGADPDAQKLVGQPPTATTIASLRALAVPAVLPPEGRSPGAEETVWQLDATLVGFTHQSSGDYSLVITDDQDNTMIAKIPDPELAPGSLFAQQIAAARQAFDSRFGIEAVAAPASVSARRQFIRAAEPITVQGLGFFDYLHGQTGVAPNAFELHPVISIVFREQAPAAVNPQEAI
jgi:KAP family P-loop domain